MTKGPSLIGRRFGKQVVVEAVMNGRVKVHCDCGTIKITPIQYLLDGQSRSCGCGRYDLRPDTVPISIGDVFERLTVEQLLGSNGRRREVLVRCSCGTRKVTYEDALRAGHAKSCGCFRRDRAAALNRSHGEAGQGRRSPLYQCWVGMRERCSSPDRYPSYVGISVYEGWANSFSSFRDYITVHLGARPPRHSLDRIDNEKGYEPGNLRWATHREQSNNRWNTSKITVDGVTRSVSDWARIGDITIATIRARLKYGWPEHLAVTTPGRRYKKRTDSN